jgi:hypothetical protein
MKKITKRDLLFFVLGLVVMFVFEIIYNWTGSAKSFKAGWNSDSKVENTGQTK